MAAAQVKPLHISHRFGIGCASVARQPLSASARGSRSAPVLLERGPQPRLNRRGREVAASALDDRASHIGQPSQPHRDPIRIVHRHQQIVDVVHGAQQLLATGQLALPHEVQEVAAQLPDGLCHALEKRGRHDPDLVGRGQPSTGHESKRDERFGEFLLGVVNETRVQDLRVLTETRLSLVEIAARLRDQNRSVVKLVPVERANGVAAGTDGAAARLQPLVPGSGLGAELAVESICEGRRVQADQPLRPPK